MYLALITLVHVAVSLVAIGAGFVFLKGLWEGRAQAVDLFLTTTLATSLTGYLFPFEKLLPSHVVGAISLALLTVAFSTRKSHDRAFVISSLASFYLNLLVLFAQTFKRLPPLSSLEPAAQLGLLIAFLLVTVKVIRARKRAQAES